MIVHDVFCVHPLPREYIWELTSPFGVFPRGKKNEQIIDNAKSDMYLDRIHGRLVAHLNRGSFASFFSSVRCPHEAAPLQLIFARYWKLGQTPRLRGDSEKRDLPSLPPYLPQVFVFLHSIYLEARLTGFRSFTRLIYFPVSLEILITSRVRGSEAYGRTHLADFCGYCLLRRTGTFPPPWSTGTSAFSAVHPSRDCHVLLKK